MDDLVQYLSHGRHSLVASRVTSAADLRQSIERGYVLLTFTGTRGGTELGVRLDRERSALRDADFANGSGVVELVGRTNLNDANAEVYATVDLATLAGEGRLAV